MLQEQDPDGKCHVRLPGGIPDYAIKKEGYYDGSYTYLDHNGNYVISDKGFKIDVYCIELEDFLWDDHNDNKRVIIDIKDKERKKAIQNEIKKIQVERDKCRRGLLYEHVFRVMEKIKEGWKIVQPALTVVGHYNVMWYVRDISKFVDKGNPCDIRSGNQDNLCQGDCGAVLESGFFKWIVRGNVIEWVLKI
jgi:hypothetical protein